MDWGVTDKGFRRKTYQDIIADMEAKAKDLFGADIDLSSASPLALFLRVVAFGLSLLWMVAEQVYNSAFVDTATGQSLDYVVKYAGLRRRAASPARRMLRFTGDPGVTIPQGFLVETPAGPPRFATMEAATIPASGAVEVLAEAVEPGIGGNVGPGVLTAIVNPIPGLNTVTNIDHPANVDGLNRETDRELRERYDLSLAKGGASTLGSIRASVLEVPGVQAAAVYHNPTMTTDSDGRPPKSVEVLALGGSDEDIARAILDTVAAGIETFGTVQVQLPDDGGQLQTIRFSRPQEVQVYVEATVTANAAYPADGDRQVQTAIIAVIGGRDADGTLHRGGGLGQSVIHSALVAAARTVPGVVDVVIRLGTSPNPTQSSNIAITGRQVAVTDADKVVVTHA